MASLPASQYFDVSQPFCHLQGVGVSNGVSCAEHCFAFDIVNARLFAAQLSAAGRDFAVGVERTSQRGRSATRCAIDSVHQRVAVRRREQGSIWYTVYDLSQALAHKFGAILARFSEPDLGDASRTFRGYAILGHSAYSRSSAGN